MKLWNSKFKLDFEKNYLENMERQGNSDHEGSTNANLQETEPAEELLNKSSSSQVTPMKIYKVTPSPSPIILKLFQYSTSHLKLPSP